MDDRPHFRRWLPLAVLGVALAVTLIATYYVRSSVETRSELRFANQVSTTRQAISSRIETQVALLRAGAAYVSADGEVDREAFHRFVERLELERRYPGIQGIGFSVRFAHDRVDSLNDAMRGELPGFTYHAADTTLDERHAIVYLEPLDERNRAAIGFDMYSEPTRRQAMSIARDSGTASVSRRVLLRQEIDENKQNGFLIYVPVYRGGVIPPTIEERRRELTGFVYSPLRADDLFARITDSILASRSDVMVFDAPDPRTATLLHDSRLPSSVEQGEPDHIDTVALDVAGDDWSLVVVSRPEFESLSGRERIVLVFVAGIVLSFVLYLVTRAEVDARDEAERSAASLARSQEALRASESRFRAIFNQAAVGIAETDLEGRLVMVNRRFSEFLGRTPEQILGRSFIELTHPDDVESSRSRVEEMRDTGEPINLLKRYLHADGSTVWGNVSAALVRDASGRPSSIVAAVEDVTARHEAETALRESDLRLRRLVESNIFGVASGEYRGTITYANDYFLTMLGYDRASLAAGQVRWDNVAPAEVRDVIRNAAAQLARSGTVAPVETEFVRRDGSTVPMLIGSALLGDSLEVGSRIIAFCLDLTERRRAEAELRQAKEAAEAANRSKDRFLAVLSHELRTPLTPVMVALEALESEKLDASLSSMLDIVRRNVALEARLIDDLLDLTRIVNGKLRLFVEPLDVHRTIRESLEIVEEIEQKRIALDVDLAADAHMIQGDAARVQQVIWNLVRNAARYTPADGRISVATRNDGSRLVISVSDTGVGIEPGDLDRIFNAFEQAEGGLRHGGLGLGLAISRTLVEMHGGTIRAESAGVGKGATFTVVLPGAFADVPARPAAAPAPVKAEGAGASVLLVEDHADTRALLEVLLRQFGYRVRSAGSVADALEAAREPFDVLVTDIGLPDGNGYDLLERIGPREGMRAVALSGYGMESDIRRSRAAGFAEHLTKPVDIRRLHDVIEALLESDDD